MTNYLSYKQAAEYIGITYGYIRKLISGGVLRSEIIDGEKMIPFDQAEKYKSGRRKGSLSFTFFDLLDEIELRISKNKTPLEIATELRCSISVVKNYSRVLGLMGDDALNIARTRPNIFTEYWFRTSGILSKSSDQQIEIIQACIDAGSTRAARDMLPKKLKKKRPEQALYIQGWELLLGTRKFRKDGMVASVIQLSELTGLDRQYIRGYIDGYEKTIREK
jgi:excisionase family DNA binding protein